MTSTTRPLSRRSLVRAGVRGELPRDCGLSILPVRLGAAEVADDRLRRRRQSEADAGRSGNPIVPMRESFAFDRHLRPVHRRGQRRALRHGHLRDGAGGHRAPPVLHGDVRRHGRPRQIRHERRTAPRPPRCSARSSARPSPAPPASRSARGRPRSTRGSRSRRPMAGLAVSAPPDRFAFTVYFDSDEAPVNHGIFGPEFTFTGEMIAGKITIGTPIGLPVDDRHGRDRRRPEAVRRWRAMSSPRCATPDRARVAGRSTRRRCSMARRAVCASRTGMAGRAAGACRVRPAPGNPGSCPRVTSCAQPRRAPSLRTS